MGWFNVDSDLQHRGTTSSVSRHIRVFTARKRHSILRQWTGNVAQLSDFGHEA